MKTQGEEFNAVVGRQLRAEIAAGGSSIAGMAREIGIARSAVDNYVTGKRAIPIPTLYNICAALGIEPHLVIARAEERLGADRARHGGTVTPLRRRTENAAQTGAEVAFDSPVSHDRDTDDLYD